MIDFELNRFVFEFFQAIESKCERWIIVEIQQQVVYQYKGNCLGSKSLEREKERKKKCNELEGLELRRRLLKRASEGNVCIVSSF